MTTGKTIALTKWAFIGKVMSLLLNSVQSALNIRSELQTDDEGYFFLCVYSDILWGIPWAHMTIYKLVYSFILKIASYFFLRLIEL